MRERPAMFPLLQMVKRLGESGVWNAIGRIHSWVYQASGGMLGHWVVVRSLLLTTTGRRSGLARTVPLAYIRDGENYVVVASNGGADRHPSWWLNLRETPRATVQIGRRRLDVVASRADAGERSRLWTRLKASNPFYSLYEGVTDRDIPVVILRPA